MPYAILSDCIDVTDRSCVEECPVDCIYEGSRKLYINPAECIDCGACEVACPVEAIQPLHKVKSEDLSFAQDNASFFLDVHPGHDVPVGNPGGASRRGPLGVDSALVRQQPSRET